MSKDKAAPPPKIGTGHASAMLRQGLKELRGALYHESPIAQPSEYGIYGTKTPGEVAESRRDEARDHDEEHSILGERLHKAQSREDRGRESKEHERE